jgi:hypothetical protein
MNRISQLLLAAMVLPSLAIGQSQPLAEIGTNLGVTISKAGGESITHFGVPGQGMLGQPMLYATFFPGRSVMLEPQLALNIYSGGGSTLTTAAFGAQVGYFFKGSTENSPFVAGSLGLQSVSGSGASHSDFALGAKFGYRALIGSSFGIRFEAGYRRWSDNKVDEISFGIGLGGIIHRGK